MAAFPKPPPLRVKLPCPTPARWTSLSPRLVKMIMLTSILVWMGAACAFGLLFEAVLWRYLQLLRYHTAIAVLFLLLLAQFGFVFGNKAGRYLLASGLAQKKMEEKLKAKMQV